VSEHKETILGEVLEVIGAGWESFNGSQHQIISLLFENQEATIEQMIQHVGVSDQAIRYNIKKLEELGIVERVSEKIRDPSAIYRFRSG
jgi:predicted transcriptional regulator